MMLRQSGDRNDKRSMSRLDLVVARACLFSGFQKGFPCLFWGGDTPHRYSIELF